MTQHTHAAESWEKPYLLSHPSKAFTLLLSLISSPPPSVPLSSPLLSLSPWSECPPSSGSGSSGSSSSSLGHGRPRVVVALAGRRGGGREAEASGGVGRGGTGGIGGVGGGVGGGKRGLSPAVVCS